MELKGKWKLYYFIDGSIKINSMEDLKNSGIACVPATVPGNVELDLSAAGVLPRDLFKGNNIRETERYEIYEWWYETTFIAEKPSELYDVYLHFAAVDCFADYYLNGIKIGHSENMFLPNDFMVGDQLLYDQVNTLHVNIKSPVIEESKIEPDVSTISTSWNRSSKSSNVRKAPHSYGWDIMPRALSAGIWRNVELQYKPKYRFTQLFFVTKSITGNCAHVTLCYDTVLPIECLNGNSTLIIDAECGDSKHHSEHTITFKSGKLDFCIDNAKLWWPKNYGEPNLYNFKVTIVRKSKLICEGSQRTGLRIAKLHHSDITDGINGCYHFEVNGVRIMAVGSNWVPLDAFHSRDAQRYEKAFELLNDVGCNIVRCWGGNVYEEEKFFDSCDESGIMVWQDFAMACRSYPQTDRFFNIIRNEAETIVKLYRHHPSIVLWSGDNEIDEVYSYSGLNPKENSITRRVLPDVIKRLDFSRSYIPSSPYISEKAFSMGDVNQGGKILPEDHLWGPRDYYKSGFYTGSNAHFVSEIGYHGCPARCSIEKFIDKEYLWPYKDNEQWNLHLSDQNNSNNRIMLMEKQVRELFGDIPTDMDDYILASQISQAEAKKFFIERIRSDMKNKGGVIWWNLLDGWPQMSDAVVDYYFEKKLAYYYIKRSSQPFIFMLDEMEAWGHVLTAANSTPHTVRGKVSVTDVGTGRIFLEKDFEVEPNSNKRFNKIPLMYSDKGMLLIKWFVDSKEYMNTYLYGSPKFDLKEYKKWLAKINN